MSFIWYKPTDPITIVNKGLREIDIMIYDLDYEINQETRRQDLITKKMKVLASKSITDDLNPLARQIMSSRRKKTNLYLEREQISNTKEILEAAKRAIRKGMALKPVISSIGAAARVLSNPRMKILLQGMQKNLQRLKSGEEFLTQEMKTGVEMMSTGEPVDEEKETQSMVNCVMEITG